MRQTYTDTKELIIAEAAKLFYGNGYAKATMRQIAAACKVSHPAIFKHFKNKAQIAETLVYRYIRGIVTMTRRYIEARCIDVEKNHEAFVFYWAAHFHYSKYDHQYYRFSREFNAARDIYKTAENDYFQQVFRELMHWKYEKTNEEHRLYSRLLYSSAGIISFSCAQDEISIEKAVTELFYILYSIVKMKCPLSDEQIAGIINTLDYDRYLAPDLLGDVLITDFGKPYQKTDITNLFA